MRPLRKGAMPVETEPATSEARLRGRIREDLRRRGVSSELVDPIAVRIATRAEGLDPVRYAVLLDGAAAAHGAQAPLSAATPVPQEIERLVQDFAIELRKLDEGLRLLSTYLLRLRDRTGHAQVADRTVH